MQVKFFLGSSDGNLTKCNQECYGRNWNLLKNSRKQLEFCVDCGQMDTTQEPRIIKLDEPFLIVNR